jgi:hypothetical protein
MITKTVCPATKEDNAAYPKQNSCCRDSPTREHRSQQPLPFFALSQTRQRHDERDQHSSRGKELGRARGRDHQGVGGKCQSRKTTAPCWQRQHDRHPRAREQGSYRQAVAYERRLQDQLDTKSRIINTFIDTPSNCSQSVKGSDPEH